MSILASINLVYIMTPLVMVVLAAVYIFAKRKREKDRGQLLEQFRKANFTGEDDLAWYIAHDIMGASGYPDCVVYTVDQTDRVCRQIAAFGPKNPDKMSILNPINIPFARGIVGQVAMSGKAERIDDTTKDPRYVPDDDIRYSELTVPVLINGKSAMVIDSEHKSLSWFKETDMIFVQQAAEIAAAKLESFRK
jgi:signal transduction protein with GAF and PtsI domain